MERRIRIQHGQKVGLKFTPEEREAVLEIIGVDDELEDCIRRASLGHC